MQRTGSGCRTRRTSTPEWTEAETERRHHGHAEPGSDKPLRGRIIVRLDHELWREPGRRERVQHDLATRSRRPFVVDPGILGQFREFDLLMAGEPVPAR